MQLQKKISRNVLLMGLTSFFTDISSEMVYPLIQAFVRAVMVNSAAALGPVLGIIEGIAESTAALLRVYSGAIADRWHKRRPLAIGGYGLSAVSKLLYLLAGFGWAFVLASRLFDRIGKGIRTAPRDALIAESCDPADKGAAFGFHRAMDYAGAFLGVLICYLISRHYLDPRSGSLRDMNAFYILFAISLIPAAIGVIMLFFVKETACAAPRSDKPVSPRFPLSGLDRRLKIFFIAVFLFTLGNSSNQFLLLKTMDAGIPLPDMLLMYMAFNIITSALSAPLGSLSDKIGRKKIILAGYGLYAMVYLLFGYITPEYRHLLWPFWALYGVYYALTEGIEKALVADIAPAGQRATIIGLYSTIVGIGLLPASLIAGTLYAVAGNAAPFIFGGGMAIGAGAVITLFFRE